MSDSLVGRLLVSTGVMSYLRRQWREDDAVLKQKVESKGAKQSADVAKQTAKVEKRAAKVAGGVSARLDAVAARSATTTGRVAQLALDLQVLRVTVCQTLEQQLVSCPACSRRNVEVAEAWPLQRQAVGCLDCGLLFVHPQPTAEALAGHYAPGGTYRTKRPVKATENAQTKTKDGAPAMLAAFDRHFPASHPQAGARVLDFGC